MQLEAQLARDRSGHAGVCRCSPLKCHTGVSYNNRVEKWRDRGRSSRQIRKSDLGEHVGEHGCGSWRSSSTTSLGRSLTRLGPNEHRGFWFRPWPPHDRRRYPTRRRAATWKDRALSQGSWPRTWLSSIEARCRGTRTSTPRHIVREPPFETEPGSGSPCRVEYRPRIDETWFRGTPWSLRWGIRRQRRGQVRGRFPEERQNRSSRYRTWDPRWPQHDLPVLYDRIQADASSHTPKSDCSRSNRFSVSIVSNASEIFSHLLTWLLTILPGYLPIKLPRSYLTMWLLTCLIVLSEFDPWLNLADPPTLYLSVVLSPWLYVKLLVSWFTWFTGVAAHYYLSTFPSTHQTP